MNILSFERFKLLLEAEGDAPEETPVEPPAAEESPAPAEPAPAPADAVAILQRQTRSAYRAPGS